MSRPAMDSDMRLKASAADAARLERGLPAMYLDEAKRLFAERLNIAPDEIQPCSGDDVDALSKRLGLALPSAYKEFLLWMGRGAGFFLRGSDVFFPSIADLREAAAELLRENGIDELLPGDAVVFYMHQGYQFMYLRASEGDDPAVHYFGEGEGMKGFSVLYPSFSQFVLREIEGHARIAEQLARQKQQ